jgi:hypothetical protein
MRRFLFERVIAYGAGGVSHQRHSSRHRGVASSGFGEETGRHDDATEASVPDPYDGSRSGGCDPFGLSRGGEGELEANRKRWASLALTSYEYVLARSCFCPPAFLGPVLVRVEDSVVTERSFVEVIEPDPGAPGESFPSVAGLFDIIADAYERDAHVVEVTYDPETGVPLDIYVDYEQNVADEELGLTVESLPVPIS